MNLKLQKLINYKNWFCVVVVAISLCSCKPVTKVVLPYSGSIPKIKYLKTTATTVKKEVNYDNLIKEIFILSPKTKIVAEDKPNGNFQIVAYSPYKYKQRELQFSYRLTCNLSEKDCNITIDGIYMVHYTIERIYFNDKRHNLKKFNTSYEDINRRINEILSNLVKQVK